MAKIDFSKIAEMLNSSTDFSLTEKQYYKLTRRNLPKDTSYLLNKSALARFSKEKNLEITVQERTISFKKAAD